MGPLLSGRQRPTQVQGEATRNLRTCVQATAESFLLCDLTLKLIPGSGSNCPSAVLQAIPSGREITVSPPRAARPHQAPPPPHPVSAPWPLLPIPCLAVTVGRSL